MWLRTSEQASLVQERYPRRFEDKALQLVAKRVSAVSGDMRSAISICDTACCQAARASRGDLSTAEHAGMAGTSVLSASDLISVSAVAAALQECCSGASAQTRTQVAAIKDLPAQQQLLLCTLAIARSGAVPLSSASSTPVALATPTKFRKPLSASFPVLSALKRNSKGAALGKPPRTPVLQRNTQGFGLARTPTATKAVNISFPRADDDVLVTPTSQIATPKTSATPSPGMARNSDLSMQEVYSKYKRGAHDAGLAKVDMSQVQAMVSALQGSGLLETRSAPGAKQVANRRVSLAVSATDVKHALADNRMLRLLVQHLP
jgi:CDC6, C terminal winged helix domain